MARIGDIMPHTEIQIAAEIRALMPQSEIREEVNRIAREAAEYARNIAPVYKGEPKEGVEPGSYRDSIHAESTGLKPSEGFESPMPSARVITRSPIANLLEFGTKNMTEFATFAQTADHFGGIVDVNKGSLASGERLD
jgi:hypothetical protein